MKLRCMVVAMLGAAACATSSAPGATHPVEDSDPFERAARAIDRAQSLVDAYGGAGTWTSQLVAQGDTLEVVSAVAVNPGWKTRHGYAVRLEGDVDAVWDWARADIRNRFLAMTPQSAIDAHALGQLQSCVVDSMQRAHPDGAPAAPAYDDDEAYSATAFAPWLFRGSSNAAPVVVAATGESLGGLTIPMTASELHPRVLVRDGQCFVVEPRLRLRTRARWMPTAEPGMSEPSEQELYAASEGIERALFDAATRLAELRRALGDRRGMDRRIGELRHLVDRDEAVMARLRQRADQLEHAAGTSELMPIPVDLLVRAPARPAPPMPAEVSPPADPAAPTITGVSPATVLLGSQAELTFMLTGTRFPDADVRVYVDSGSSPVQMYKQEVTRVSATQIALTVTAPSNAALRALFPPEVAQRFRVAGLSKIDKATRRVSSEASSATFTPHLPLRATSLCRVHAPSVDLQLRLQIPAVPRDARVNLVQTDDANQAAELIACSNAQVFGADDLVCFVPERTVLGPRTRIQVLRATEHTDPDASNESQLGARWSSDAGVECTGLEPVP